MEIPYIVTPRKDTGLFNSKIAIWLFLASEVMLFGGFFSAYIFLRLGADFPWPERTLPVLPGLINTFVLIGSSVTVVFAWASLKMRQWGRFQFFMGITVLCAFIFMGLKGVEYYVKLHHQAVRLKDYAVVEGHLGKALKDGVELHHGEDPTADQLELDHTGKPFEENVINYETSQINFNTVRFHKDWVEGIIARAEEKSAEVKLSQPIVLGIPEKDTPAEAGKPAVPGAATLRAQLAEGGSPAIPAGATVFAKGTKLTVELLEKIQDAHQADRAKNGAMRTKSLRASVKSVKEANPDKKDREIASQFTVDPNLPLLAEAPSVAFEVSPATVFHFKPRDIQEASGALRDGTALVGKLLESPMVFHYVDAIDFRHTAMKAVDKNIDPEVAIENSWLLKSNPELREAWEWHRGEIAKLEKELLDQYGVDKKTGKPNREPTPTERYRIGWKDFVAKADGIRSEDVKIHLKEEFMGPSYDLRAEKHTFPHLIIPREEVLFASKFAPAWNTYYAVYFTMTALHGLHVIGGAIVLGYYLFRGKKMYLSNPEWLANRVEIGGLFWHFVDLVWIFLFPILYLM